LALEAVDRDNSCLHYLPQSHLQAVRDHAATSVLGFSQGISDITAEERARGVPVELAAGDLAVHHGNTIHWADCNRSNRRRPAFAMVFQGESCQRDEEAYARYMARLSQQHAEMGVGDAT
jgi:phytanoyl-CoA hydroxylase